MSLSEYSTGDFSNVLTNALGNTTRFEFTYTAWNDQSLYWYPNNIGETKTGQCTSSNFRFENTDLEYIQSSTVRNINANSGTGQTIVVEPNLGATTNFGFNNWNDVPEIWVTATANEVAVYCHDKDVVWHSFYWAGLLDDPIDASYPRKCAVLRILTGTTINATGCFRVDVEDSTNVRNFVESADSNYTSSCGQDNTTWYLVDDGGAYDLKQFGRASLMIKSSETTAASPGDIRRFNSGTLEGAGNLYKCVGVFDNGGAGEMEIFMRIYEE